MPGAPPNAGTTNPESSASAGSRLAVAAASAFSAAFASKLSPVSSGSGSPSAPAPLGVTAKGVSNALISFSFPGLCVAMTSRPPVNLRATASLLLLLERRPLQRHQLIDAMPRQGQHLGEAALGEGHGLGGRLDLDDAAPSGQDKFRIGLCRRVLGIVEVEHGGALADSARDRRYRVQERYGRKRAHGDELSQRPVKRHVAAGDRRGARTAIGLEHVAIDADLALTQRGEVGYRPQAAPDEPLDLLGAAALLAACGFPVGAGMRGAGQHAVFGGNPAPSRVAQEGRHLLLHACGAEDVGVAEPGEAGALGIFGKTRLQAYRAQLVEGTTGRTCHGRSLIPSRRAKSPKS